jgi:hypothetical protein
VSWQEKNIAVGLAALFVLIVMAHLTFGSGPTTNGSVVTEPAPAPTPEAKLESAPAVEPTQETL